MYLFFFSSRRRHTISKRDWSSDVCSSDLNLVGLLKRLCDSSINSSISQPYSSSLLIINPSIKCIFLGAISFFSSATICKPFNLIVFISHFSPVFYLLLTVWYFIHLVNIKYGLVSCMLI